MIISGSGITTPLRFWINKDYQTKTILSLKWSKTKSGSWVATDRGSDTDIYQAIIKLYGLESTIDSFLSMLYDNRTDPSGNIITMTDFASDELIFGCDVDHTSIDATIVSYGQRKQTSFHTFSVSVTLEAEKPLSFNGTAGSVNFDHVDFGYTGDNTYTGQNIYSYSGVPSYVDEFYDSGVLEFTATMKTADAIVLRRSLATSRSNAISTTLARGMTNAFGAIRDNTWPKNLKYPEWEDLGPYGQHFYRFNLKAVEHIS